MQRLRQLNFLKKKKKNVAMQTVPAVALDFLSFIALSFGGFFLFFFFVRLFGFFWTGGVTTFGKW